MVDTAITVDELAIKVVAEASTAATNIDALAGALNRLARALNTPGMRRLGSLGPSIARINAGAITAQGKIATQMATSPAVAGAAKGAGVAASTAAATADVAAMAAPLAQTGTAIQAVGSKTSVLSEKLQTMAKTGSGAAKTLGGSFIQLRSTIFFAFFAISAIIGAFKVFLGAAVALVEKINLFQVAMGTTARAANDYADSITNMLGVDPQQFRELNSTFYLMASSLGMVSETATTVSRNFTQLTYDYASLFDMDFETVSGKFRSAMAGQTRAVAALGLDVTLASLKMEALKEGIEGNVATFTKANKIILMHNLIVRNSTKIQGDLARTLSSPANMMRVLSDQFQVAARVIGWMFMPALQAILPVLIYVTQAVAQAGQAFLALFGIKMPSWNDFTQQVAGAAQGTDDLFGDMTDVTAATKAAADEAKKLKDYTMGIDELNIIKPPTIDTAAGAPGGGTIAPFDVYDMIGGAKGLSAITDPIKAMFKNLGVVFAPFLKALSEVWDALKPFAKDIWKGFVDMWNNVIKPMGVWVINTVGVLVLERIKAVLEWFNAHPKASEALGGVLAILMAFKGITTVLKILGWLIGIFSKLLGFTALKGILAGIFGAFSDMDLLFGGGSGSITTGFGLFVAKIMAFTWPAWLLTAGETIGAIFSAFAVGGPAAGFEILGAAIGPVGWIVLGIVAVIAAGVALWKNWDKVSEWAKTLGDTISTTWKNLVDGAVITWANITTAITDAWGNLGAAVAGAWAAITDPIVAAWDTLATMVSEVWNMYIVKPIIDAWNTISEQTASVWKTISDGLAWVWNIIKAIILIPVALIGTAIILAWTWLSTEATRIWTIITTALTDAWTWISVQAVVIWQTVTDPIIAGWNWISAEATRIWTIITGVLTGAWQWIAKQATSIWNGITGFLKGIWNGVVTALTSAWGVIKTKTQEAWNFVYKAVKGPIEAIVRFITPVFATIARVVRNVWNGLTAGLSAAWDAIKGIFKSGVNFLISAINNGPIALLNKVISAAKSVDKTDLMKKVNRVATIPYLADGGSVPAGRMFVAGDAGPEIVGSYGGNNNTVMPLENSGFVEAMAAAVYSATTAALRSAPQSSGGGDVFIDGVKAGKIIKTSTARAGVGGMISVGTAGNPA